MARKRTLALLFLALCLALSGCAAPKVETLQKTCAELADQVQAAAEFRELTEMNEKHLEKYLLIDAADLEDWAMRRDASRNTAEMILVVKVKAGADQASVKKALESYLTELRNVNGNYQPSEAYKLDSAQVLENGAYLAMIVSPDAKKTSAALGSGWK